MLLPSVLFEPNPAPAESNSKTVSFSCTSALWTQEKIIIVQRQLSGLALCMSRYKLATGKQSWMVEASIQYATDWEGRAVYLILLTWSTASFKSLLLGSTDNTDQRSLQMSISQLTFQIFCYLVWKHPQFKQFKTSIFVLSSNFYVTTYISAPAESWQFKERRKEGHLIYCFCSKKSGTRPSTWR